VTDYRSDSPLLLILYTLTAFPGKEHNKLKIALDDVKGENLSGNLAPKNGYALYPKVKI